MLNIIISYYSKIKLKLCEWYDKIPLLDKYIMKQVLEVFSLGLLIFTSIIFASDTFITLVRQISLYGVPFHIALMMIVLNLPSVILMAIPMSTLLATVMPLNKLCLSSEITVMKACGIGLNRIAKPIFIFALFMSLFSFVLNETIIPVTRAQAQTLALWALGQKNVPNGKYNFTYQETGKNPDGEGEILKRFFYIGHCLDDNLYNILVLDVSNPKQLEIIYSKTGSTEPNGWKFYRSSTYTISKDNKILNNAWIGESVLNFGLDLKDEITKTQAKQYNMIALFKYVNQNKKMDAEELRKMKIEFHDKFAFPFTTVVLVLLGVPLSITPPRVRYNRGFLFSIIIIFFYYLFSAFSKSLGISNSIPSFFAAWLPNMILFVVGIFIYRRKVFTIT